MRAFASVSAHFSLHEFFASNPFLSDDQKADMLRPSNEARQVYFETGVVERNAMFWPDMTGSEEDVDSREIFDYYFARREKCWPNFSNHLVPFSYEQLLGSHALDCAKFLTAPYLGVVGSEAMTLSYAERFMAEKTHGERELFVVERATHMKAYDHPEYVEQAVEGIAGFFQKHIAQSKEAR